MSRSRLVVALASLISLGCDDPPVGQDADENGESSSESESGDEESSTGEDEGTTQSLDGESTDGESSDGESSEGESTDGESSEDESSEDESSEDESTDGETGEPTECPSSTDIAGEPASLPTSPDCEIVCLDGWSNPTAPLAVEWVLDLEMQSSAEALLPGTDGSVLVIAEGDIPTPIRMHSISSAGELEWTTQIMEIGSSVHGATSDSSNTVYVGHIGNNPLSWAPEAYFSAISPMGEYQWSAHSSYGMILSIAARDEGIVALVGGPGFLSFDRYVVAVSSQGTFEWNVETSGTAQRVGVAPNGDIVVTDGSEYLHYTSMGVPVATHAQAFEADWLSEVGFLADGTMIQTGSMLEGNVRDGLIAWQQLGGPGGYERYRMGDAICNGPVWSGHEMILGFAALPDGGLVLVGDQAFDGHPEPWAGARPWVGHVDADGDLLAVDLGVWNGSADDVMVGPDGSVLVLINHQAQDMAFQVRKYLLE